MGEPVRSLLEGASPAVLRSLGIPTTGAEWSDVGTLAGIGSLAAMLVGALLGGMLGERWHTKLTRRAASPNDGPVRDQPTTDDRAATTRPAKPTAGTRPTGTCRMVAGRPGSTRTTHGPGSQSDASLHPWPQSTSGWPFPCCCPFAARRGIWNGAGPAEATRQAGDQALSG